MLRVLLRASGIFCLLILASAQSVWAAQKSPGELCVYASITMTEALTEVAKHYELATGQKIRLNFAASSLNSQQIEMGVPCDLVISADTKWHDYLDQKNLLLSQTKLDWLTSHIVLVVNKDSPLIIRKAEDLLQPKVGRIALSDPNNHSSGIRTRLYLQRHNIWNQLQTRLIITSNSRATLSLVEQDRVGIGFVHNTDAIMSHNARVVCEIPTNEIPPVHFIAAITRSITAPERAAAFLKALNQPELLAIFKRYGFSILKTGQN